MREHGEHLMMITHDERFVRLTNHVWRGGAFAYYWTNPGKQSYWFEVGNLPPIQNGTARNTYFGIHPVTADNPREPGTRSRIAHIAAINCVFAEFDAKDFNGSQAAVDAHVAALPLTPSMVIFSGGGSHCYWLLREPLIIDSDRTREWACNLQAAWVKFVGSDDGAKDLARVLRVPGTRNYKPDYKPDFPKVEFIKADFDQLYELVDFDDLLERANAKSQSVSTETYPAIRAAESSGMPSAYALAALRNETNRVRGATEGTRNTALNKAAFALGQFVGAGELSRSDVESELLDAALAAGLSESEVRDTLRSGIEAGMKEPRQIPQRSLAIADVIPDDVPSMPIPDVSNDLVTCNVMRTDAGNGQRFARRHGTSLKYHESIGWLFWNDRYWQRDDTGEVMRRARETARSIFDEAKLAANDDAAAVIGKWATASQSNGRLMAMINQAQSELAIVLTPDQLDRDLMLLSVGNGTLDLRTGQLRPHNCHDLITKITDVEYNPDAACPRWINFLDRIMAGNQAMIDFLQRATGYMLTGDTSEQCLFFLHGSGKNGKTVFTFTLQSLLGDYAKRTPTDTLIAKRGDSGIPNDVARLPGARVVIATELPEGKQFNEQLIKDLTGQDVIVARFLHHEFFEFRPQFKLMIFGNHKPDIRGTDEGIWRRVRLIPFDVTIPESEQDTHLLEKLCDELPGILAWAVRGCLEWQRIGLGTPDKVRKATNDYRAEMDVLEQFLNECCVILPDARVGASALYAAYKRHAEASGNTVENTRVFRQRMFDHGFSLPKHTDLGSMWRGLGLSDTYSADEN
jgi:putative DNA primase/helicase